MKRLFPVLLGLLSLLQTGCTGSGAVNPLTPSKASQVDPSAMAADSDVIYWSSFPLTVSVADVLNGVYLVSKKSGWACGNNGVIMKYDGETWTKVETGFAKNENLLAVTFANENEGWFVGSHGVILHYNNGNWNQDDSQTQETLFSVAVTRSRTVWAAGTNGTLLTYNGVSWGKIDAGIKEDLYSIGLSDQNNGWAVGNRGTILRYDGQKWQSFAASPTTEKLNSVSVISDVQAWAVGAFGTILRFNGTTWNKMGSAFSGFDLYQIYMRTDDDGWATGQDGTLIYYDGTRWISHEKPKEKPALNGISFYKDLGFIVGQNGTFLKFQPNGEPAKFSFLFRGEVAKKPTKGNPYWTLTYTLMNQSPKTSPALIYDLTIPKGFEPYQKKEEMTPTPSASGTGPSFLPTPAATLGAGSVSSPFLGLNLNQESSAAATGSGFNGLGAPPNKMKTPGLDPSKTTPKTSSVTGNWKMKDGSLQWEIGTVASSEIKTVTVLISDKPKEKKEYPVLLKAILKSNDKVIAEAAPVTMMAEAPKEKAAPTTTLSKPTTVLKPAVTVTPQASPSTGGPEEGDSPNAKPTPTPGKLKNRR